MKKYIYIIIVLLGFVSCNSEMDNLPDDCNPIVLKGIRADIWQDPPTRAVTPLVDSIGKYGFLTTDMIVFTKIERTKRPIRPTFSYEGVQYSCQISDKNVSWKRESPADDIFWSDGLEPHTFIGYILPHNDDQTAVESGYDWHHDTTKDVYYGSIGNPTDAREVIDYTGAPQLGEDQKAPYDTEKLRKEDLLLTYSTEMQNEDAMARVHFHHGLASIRVAVTITGYSSTGEDPDAQTEVTDMVVHNQPTMYKWNNHGFSAAPLEEGDQAILNGFSDWGGEAPAWNQKKEMKLWQPRKYHGTGASRTFTFYGITAPGEQSQVDMTFKVSYPNPLDPNQTNRLEKEYTATLQLPDSKNVEFRPGYCTSININLNHKDEKMTVGAEYMSWKFDPAPNEGSLRKNSTYLSYTERSKITIVGDPQATVYDATWLYVDPSTRKILDVYGNDGSGEHPFLISTADQLLSFAYEVKGINRTSTTYRDLDGTDKTLSDGFAFTGYFVKLDADITLQPNDNVMHDAEGFYALDSNGNRTTPTGIVWPGIGDTDKPFNGNFLGSSCYINKLYGKALFTYLGPNAIVEHVFISKTLGITSKGSVAEVNEGVICGFNVEGDIKVEDRNADYCGSIVGLNTGVLLACSHIGDTEGYGTVGALVGKNDGVVAVCYCVGNAKTKTSGKNAYAGIGEFTERSIAYCCYFNKDLYTTNQDYVDLKANGTIGHVAFPLSTAEMQSNKFVNLPCKVDPETGKTIEGEITDVRDKDDIFYSHFSLNGGLRRFVEYFFAVYAQTPETQDIIYLHAPGATEDHTENQVPLAKTIARWLWEHFDYTTEGALRYEFKFVPATYPKLH